MAVGHPGIQSNFLISFTPVDRTRLRKPPRLMHSRWQQCFLGQMRLLIIIGLVFITVDNFACSCKHVGILKNKKQSNFVFKGLVTELNELVTSDTITGTNQTIEYRRTKYTFEILSNYKGLKGEEKINLITSTMTDCGVNFDKGATYIVYANVDFRKLHYKLADQRTKAYATTHLCMRTKKTNGLTFWETFVLWLT